MAVESLEVDDDGVARITASLLGDAEAFERIGDTLVWVRGAERLHFERCQPGSLVRRSLWSS
jgi:hypothetical protein